jgi:hypothetical protein
VARFEAFVRALGAEFDGDPVLGSVVIAPGLDGEATPIKYWRGVDWPGLMRAQAPAVEYRFGQMVPECIRWYREAFPTTPVYANLAAGSGRCTWAQDAIDVGAGLKNAGLVPDMDSWWANYPRYCGNVEPWMEWSDDVWFESKHGGGNPEFRQWSLYAGAHYGPAALSLHREWLDGTPPDALWQGYEQLSQGAAWVVLRDSEYPDTGAYSGHRGPWGRGIVATGWDLRVRANLPYGQASPYARQCGWVADGGWLLLDIDDALDLGASSTVRVVWLDRGGPMRIKTAAGERDVADYRAWAWDETVLRLPGLRADGNPDLAIRGEAWVHRVEVIPDDGNLLANPGMEGTFTERGAGEIKVAEDWHPFYKNGPGQGEGYNRRPEWKPYDLAAFGPRQVHSGRYSQVWFSTYSTHTGGVYQRVPATPGDVLLLTAWSRAWSSTQDDPDVSAGGAYHTSVGIDPTGGTDWTAPGVIWSEEIRYHDAWVRHVLRLETQADHVTVFLKGRAEWRVKHNDVSWDDVSLVVTGGTAPTPTPTPTEVPSATPTPTATPTRTATATRWPTATATRSATPTATATARPSVTPTVVRTPTARWVAAEGRYRLSLLMRGDRVEKWLFSEVGP